MIYLLRPIFFLKPVVIFPDCAIRTSLGTFSILHCSFYPCLLGGGGGNKTVCDADNTETCTERTGSNILLVFMLAQFVHGIGFTPMFTLGTAYVDDNAPTGSTAIYLGMTFCGYNCKRKSFEVACPFVLNLFKCYIISHHGFPPLSRDLRFYWYFLCRFLLSNQQNNAHINQEKTVNLIRSNLEICNNYH